ncbi:MAG: DUF2304 domain-containing protein [Ruminococcaceae bacterium]|nr:DUF2304 domain-containing protein [Oscillospiraceae bacterium]
MDGSLRIFLSVSVFFYFVMLAIMLKNRSLGLRYSLVWIICGFGMVLFIAFPNIVFSASAFIGISNPVNAIFFFFAVFVTSMLISTTSILSKMNEKNLRMTQYLALLEERVTRLESEKKDE